MKTKRRHHIPEDDEMQRPTSSSSNFISLKDFEALPATDQAVMRVQMPLATDALAESARILNRRPWRSQPERLNEAGAGALPLDSWLKEVSLLRTEMGHCPAIRTEVAESTSNCEDDDFHHHRTPDTSTGVYSSSPAFIPRHQLELTSGSPIDRVRESASKRSSARPVATSVTLGRSTSPMPEGVVPESDPPTPRPRKRVKLDSLAYRKHVFDAVHGYNGLQWADVGLVSVNGHQEREVEL